MKKETREALTNETFRRDLTFDRKSANVEARTVPASLSSETPVERWFGNEILSHAEEAIDLERALDGLPMLFGHDHSKPIGLVKDIKIENGKLRGVLHFSNNSTAEEVFRDVQEGFLNNISIGYAVKEWSENSENDDVTITRWALLETSVVPVPADNSVGINRSKEDITMSKDDNKPDVILGDNLKLVDFHEARKLAMSEGREEGLKLERERTDSIENLFINFKANRFQSLKAECIRQGTSKERSSELLLELVGKDVEPIAGVTSETQRGDVTRIQTGEDSLDKMKRGMTEALKVKVDVVKDKSAIQDVRANEFFSMNPVELARHYLSAIGFDTRGLNRLAIVGEAFVRAPGMSGTSDFANILASVSHSALMMGYNEAPETWASWCRKGNLTDFKAANRVNLSEFGDLELVSENGEYKHGNLSDSKETIQLAKYGKLFSITREALINDDLDALGRIPASMGRAAARKVGDIAYGVLTANANLSDGTALFHADHSNLKASGGSAPTVAAVDAMRVAMGTQTGPKGATLAIRPAHLIVPLALEGTAKALMAAQYDPAGTAGTLTPNTVQGTMDVISESRLDADSAIKWYGMANANQADTVEVAFLDGNESPWMEQVNEFTRDGITHKVRIEAAAAALDYRGIYQNSGS